MLLHILSGAAGSVLGALLWPKLKALYVGAQKFGADVQKRAEDLAKKL